MANMAAQEPCSAVQGALPQANQVGDTQPPPSFPTGLSFPCSRISSLRYTQVFNHLSSAAPPHPIIPRPVDIHPTVNIPMLKEIDKRGRPVPYQGGGMVCNNFNHLGCTLSICLLLHACSFCRGPHVRSTCPHNPTMPAD